MSQDSPDDQTETERVPLTYAELQELGYVTQLGTIGADSVLRRLYEYSRELEAEASRLRGYSRSERLCRLIQMAMSLLRPGQSFRVQFNTHYSPLSETITIYVYEVQPLNRSISDRHPLLSESQPFVELVIGSEELAFGRGAMGCRGEVVGIANMETYALVCALELLREMHLEPNTDIPDGVGTTEPSNRGFASEYDITFQETNQRHPNFSSTCNCRWCQRSREYHARHRV